MFKSIIFLLVLSASSLIITTPLVAETCYRPAKWNETFDQVKKCAEKGDAEAQYDLGVLLHNGRGVTKNGKEAIKWYTKSAKLGYPKALYFMGNLFRYGGDEHQNYKRAIDTWILAANKGFLDAQITLGYAYLSGEIVKKDKNKAIFWMTKAAEQGAANQQTDLGIIYFDLQEYSKAFKWLTKAAEQRQAKAQYVLGVLYTNGHGVKQDHKKPLVGILIPLLKDITKANRHWLTYMELAKVFLEVSFNLISGLLLPQIMLQKKINSL